MVDPAGLPIKPLATEQTHEQIDGGHLSCGWPMVHPATMMRAAAVRAVGGYRQPFDTLRTWTCSFGWPRSAAWPTCRTCCCITASTSPA